MFRYPEYFWWAFLSYGSVGYPGIEVVYTGFTKSVGTVIEVVPKLPKCRVPPYRVRTEPYRSVR